MSDNKNVSKSFDVHVTDQIISDTVYFWRMRGFDLIESGNGKYEAQRKIKKTVKQIWNFPTTLKVVFFDDKVDFEMHVDWLSSEIIETFNVLLMEFEYYFYSLEIWKFNESMLSDKEILEYGSNIRQGLKKAFLTMTKRTLLLFFLIVFIQFLFLGFSINRLLVLSACFIPWIIITIFSIIIWSCNRNRQVHLFLKMRRRHFRKKTYIF